MNVLVVGGAGYIGSHCVRQLVAAGHNPVVHDKLIFGHRAATSEDAAAASELVVVTIPLSAVDQIPAAPLAGKVVIDTCNYYPQRDGHIVALDDESTTTSERVQQHRSESKVGKAFNNLSYAHLLNPTRAAGSPARVIRPLDP